MMLPSPPLPFSILFTLLTYHSQPWPAPVRTNQIPRQIPPAISYLRPIPSLLLVGALPFGAIFVELFFIMNSLWFSKIYYMFGFLFLCYGLMIMTCAAVTVMFVYYMLCAENHRWQWRAFNSAGAGAVFIFAFSIFYWIWRLRFAGFSSAVLYVGYSALISFLFFILTGKLEMIDVEQSIC
jgi:transmembrane 9 superfamily member 2/4